MLEGSVMEYAKWFTGLVGVAFIIVAVVSMFQMNEVNTFQQEVNYQIERHGGLTEDAMVKLNNHAKEVYGGCLTSAPEDGAPCLFPEDRKNPEVESSGFFVREIETVNGNLHYKDRTNEQQARYGTSVEYVLTRKIGNIGGQSFLKPAVIGESASRVRGVE